MFKSAMNEEAARIQAAADALEPRLRLEFLRLVERLKNMVDLELLAASLQRGDYGTIEQIMGSRAAQTAAASFATTVQDYGILAGAEAAIANLPALMDRWENPLRVVFNVTNPRTSTFLEQYRMDKIRQLTEDARQSVRQALTIAIKDGRNPLDSARDIRGSIGLTDRQQRAVNNYRKGLKNLDAAVLERALRDKRFDPTIDRAIRTGKPLTEEQVDRMTERYRERYLKYRSETIARTESIRAVQSGQHLLYQQMVESGDIEEDKVRRFWITTGDHKVRDSHREIPGMNKGGVGLKEPFRSPMGNIMYPGDPAASAENVINCRCTALTRVVEFPDVAQ